MNTQDRVAVCSRSFSRHPVLRQELLQRYQHVTFNDRGMSLEGMSLIAFIQGHNKAITALETINDLVLAGLPELEVISKYGVGLDMIDQDAVKRHGKRLSWTAGVNRLSAAELALALAIVTLRKVVAGNREILAGEWRQLTGGLLSGRTVGIIGCGHIGQELVRLLKPFSCTILINDIRDRSEFCSQHNVRAMEKDHLLQQSDVVSLHVPLDESTRNMISREKLALMKSSAILLNLARGGLVDEIALKEALQQGKLAGAAFDVFAQEPPSDRELLQLPNFLATPHLGGSAEEAILAMGRAAIVGLDPEITS